MIVAKPKISTLFSLGVFIALSLGASGFALGRYFGGGTMHWYHYALIFIFFPVGMGLLFRQLLGYRIVKVAKEKIEIRYPSRFSKRTYKLNEIKAWRETQVKTFSGNFKELEIMFTDNRKIALSMQEHTDYSQLIKYLNKKCRKLRTDA